MDANQILATGGVSGATGLILLILYKIIRHSRIKSECCGKTVLFESEVSPKNQPTVDEEQGFTSSKTGIRKGRVRTLSISNESRVQSTTTAKAEQSPSCSSDNTTTENPIHQSLP